MAIEPEASSARGPFRKADFDAWRAAVRLAARRRLSARWMPLSAAALVLGALVIFHQLGLMPALIGLAVLFLAGAFWPLDTAAMLETLIGTSRISQTENVLGLDRKGWRAMVDAIPTAAVAL